MNSSQEIKYRGNVLTQCQSNVSIGIYAGGLMLAFIAVILTALVMAGSEFAIVHNCYSGSSCFELENGDAVWRRDFNHIDLENQAMTLHMIPESLESIDFLSNLSLSVVGIDTEKSTEGHQILTETKDCRMECDSDTCKKCNIFYFPTIEYNSYTVEITFLDTIPEQVTSIKFELRFVKRDFTFRQLVFKYSLFFLSVVSLVVHLSGLCTVPFRDWPLVTKLITVVNISLILFNEPLFVLNIYQPSKALFFFSSFCFAQFIIILFGCCFLIIHKNKSLRQKALYGIVLIAFFVLSVNLFAELDFQNRYGLYCELNTTIVINHIFVFLGFVVLDIIVFVFTICTTESISSTSDEQTVAKIFATTTFGAVFMYLFIPSISYFFFLPVCNIFLFTAVFIFAPVRVSAVEYQNFRELEEIEDDRSDKVHSENFEIE